MEEKKLEKIKVFNRNDPQKKVIAILKDLSKKDSLEVIREQLRKKNKMSDDYFFVDKDNDILDKDLESDSTLEDALINDNGIFKLFLSPQDEKPEDKEQEKELKSENVNQSDVQKLGKIESNDIAHNSTNSNKNESNKENIINSNIQNNGCELKNEVKVSQNDTQNLNKEIPICLTKKENNNQIEVNNQKKEENQIKKEQFIEKNDRIENNKTKEKKHEIENTSEIKDIITETQNSSVFSKISDIKEINSETKKILSSQNKQDKEFQEINLGTNILEKNEETIKEKNNKIKDSINELKNKDNNLEEIKEKQNKIINNEDNDIKQNQVENILNYEQSNVKNEIPGIEQKQDIIKEQNILDSQGKEINKQPKENLNKNEKGFIFHDNGMVPNNQNSEDKKNETDLNLRNEEVNIKVNEEVDSLNNQNKINQQNLTPKKNKEYFFTTIINSEYSDNVKFIFKSNQKVIQNNLQEIINDFEKLEISSWYWNSSIINRKLHLLKVSIPAEYETIQLDIQIKMGEVVNSSIIKIGKLKKNINLNLKPLNEIKGFEEIFFDLKTEKEFDSFVSLLVNFFKEQDNIWKKEFIISFLQEQINMIPKKFKYIFSLVEIYNDNFLELNFAPVLADITKFIYEKPFIILQFMKEKLIKLYNDIKDFPNKEEININVWPFLILLLMKMEENNKIFLVLSLIDNLNNKDTITKLFFSRIKSFMELIPEINNYFINILKYQPNEINYISLRINSYEKYLDIIIANTKYIKNQIFHIFPPTMKKK